MRIAPEEAAPRLAVLAVVVRAGRVLLVQRANPPDAGKWGFPGGRVALGETMAAAAARELREETGVEAEPLDVLTALDVIDRDDAGGVRFHYVLIAMLCRWRAGDGVAADDAQEVCWLNPDEIGTASRPLSASVRQLAQLAVACTAQVFSIR